VAFDITATMQAIQTHLRDSNLFRGVDIINVTSPPPVGPYAALEPVSMSVVSTTLTNPIEVHVVRVSLYLAPYLQNDQNRVLLSSTLTSEVMDLLYGDFELGGNIRNIDVAGQYGAGLEVEFVDEEVATTPTHIATITVPLIVDSATSFVA
jgi:hypothetical protein